MSAAFRSDAFIQRMWERFAVKKAVQLEARGCWQVEELELLRVSHNLRAVRWHFNASRVSGVKSGRLGELVDN